MRITMERFRRWGLCMAFALCVVPLYAQLDSLVRHRLPAGSDVGIAAYDLTAKKPLYAYRSDKLSRPASTMKLLTAITALSQEDADEPFRTEVWYRGEVADDTLRGDLYVKGGFDPEFDEAAMDSLVNAVARLPFAVVEGKLYGDVSMKDSLYWGDGWAWDDTPAAYQPYLSPLMYCKGKVEVTATPARKGETADTVSVTCRPASTYYTVENHAQSRTPAEGAFRVTRNWLENGNRIMVGGYVDRRRTEEINIFGSAEFFIHTFADKLRRQGVEVMEGVSVTSAELDYGEACLAATHVTLPDEVLKQMMKESDNLCAEAMLYRLGAQTTGRKHLTAADGLSAIRALIRRIGFDPDRYRLADGCGLSNYNSLSPELLVAFLRHAHSHTDLFRKLYGALPVAGIDGTLKHRMKGTVAHRNVRAKTGSFTGINCLAGYLTARNGHLIAFAVMNQNVLSGREARAFQDAVCIELAK